MATADALPFFRDDALPKTFGELEKALALRFADHALRSPGADRGNFWAPAGPAQAGRRPPLSPAIASLSATYWWDMYHDEPLTRIDDLRWRLLVEYAVRFTSGYVECTSLLERRFGAPRDLQPRGEPDSTPTQRVFGPLFVAREGGDAFALRWFLRVPDWAVPEPDPATRTRVLGELAAALSDGRPLEEVARLLREAPAEAGIQVEARGSSFALVPAMAAIDLARALGFGEVMAQCKNLHMARWMVVRRDTDEPFATPMLGNSAIDLYLEGQQPGGAEVRGRETGLGAARELGAADLVRRVDIR